MKKLLISLLGLTSIVLANNIPCEGASGGIDHCADHKFVCKDGTISHSKKHCHGYSTGRTTSNMKMKGAIPKASSPKSQKHPNSPNTMI